MAVYDVQCNALTGGASGALDYVDGNSLSDGSKALVQTNGVAYLYRLNASSGAAESSPGIISPDSNAGTKRWILQGIYLATAQLASGTSINEFSIDGTLAGNSDDAVPTEKAVKTYVDGVGGLTPSTLSGYVARPEFEYKDTDEIYINPGRYHHNGTAEQFLYWNSRLTYQFGSAGSNANSSDLGASEWHYLYIDDSELSGATMVAGEFVNNTNAPTYSVTKHGWYNGNDRCIGAFLTNASSQILGFYHDGGDFFKYDSDIVDLATYNTTTTPYTVYLKLPGFSTKALCTFSFAYNSGATAALQYTTGSSSGTTTVGYVNSASERSDLMAVVMTGDSQGIKVVQTATGANTTAIRTSGYYFPRGM
jgi:hypothetical protein